MAVRIAQRRGLPDAPRPPRRGRDHGARRRGLGDHRERAARLGEEARGQRVAAHEPRHQALQHRDQLRVEIRGQVEPERFLPGERAEPRQGAQERARERHRVGPRPAARADEPARGHVEGRVGERGGPPAGHAAVEPRAMAEQVHRPQAEADRDPRGAPGQLQRGERPDQQREEGRMGIAIGGEARHHLHRPRALAEALQVLAHPDERAHDVEVVHLDQLAPPAVEEHHLAQREQLERAPEARPGPAGRAGDAPHLAVLAGVEVHEAVALPEGAPPDHHRAGLVERHVRTSGGSRTPGAPCRPCASPSARARCRSR